ncbi:MAG: polysaccharide biosynthesis C-terminal domain-containing protein [Myxococcota bacterium]
MSTAPAEEAEDWSGEGRRLARNSVLLASGDAAALALGLLTTLIVTDQLGDDYGRLIAAQRVAVIFVAVAQFGLGPLLVRAIASTPDRSGSLVATVVAARAGLSICYALLLAGFAVATDVLPDDRWLLAIFAGVEILGCFSDCFAALCEGRERMGSAALIFVARSVVTFSGALFVMGVDGGLAGYAAVYLLARSIQFLTAVVLGFRVGWEGPLRPDFSLIPGLMKEAIWFVSMTFVASAQSAVAIAGLSRLAGVVETARYGAALNFVEVGLMLPMLLQRVLLPAFSRLSVSKGAEVIANHSLRIVPALMFPAALGIALLSDRLVQLYPSGGFDDAASVLRLQAWVLFAVAPLSVLASYLTGIGQIRTLLLCQGAGLLVQVAGHAFLIPKHGAEGAALAVLMGYSVSSLMVLAVGWTRGVRPDPIVLLRTLAACAVMGGVVTLLGDLPLAIVIGLGAIAYFLAYGVFAPADSPEKRFVFALLSRGEAKT